MSMHDDKPRETQIEESGQESIEGNADSLESRYYISPNTQSAASRLPPQGSQQQLFSKESRNYVEANPRNTDLKKWSRLFAILALLGLGVTGIVIWQYLA